MIAVLVVGALLGYAAASSRLDVLHRADGGPTQQHLPQEVANAPLQTSVTSEVHAVQRPMAATASHSAKPAAGTCCALGSAKGQLVAMANNAAALEQTASGKKPNILFIMGDDIGWMQPACYHRGLMVGETPNIDRIAAEGGIFMHYF